MLTELQKLKIWIEAEAEKAKAKANNLEKRGFDKEAMNYYYASAAFSEVVRKLSLLLNTENENGGKNEASNGGKPM